MSVERCNHCLSPEIQKSRLHLWDLFPLLIGLRAYRCAHCFERQYRAVTFLSRFVAWGLTCVDNTVNLIDPVYRQDRFGRRHRSSTSSEDSTLIHLSGRRLVGTDDRSYNPTSRLFSSPPFSQ